MAATTAFEAPGHRARPRTAAGPARGHALRGSRARWTDLVRALARAAFLASCDDTLDEAGVLRTAVAQQRRAAGTP